MKKLFSISDRYNFNDHLSIAQRISFEQCLKKARLPINAHALSMSTGDGVWDYIAFVGNSRIKKITATDIVDNPVSKSDIKLLNSLGAWKFMRVPADEILPFKNETFNLVYHVDVIEHVSKPFLFVKEQYRVLKKNGYIILNTPNILRPANLFKLFLGKLDFPCDIGSYEKIGAYIHIQEFTEWNLIQMLEETGFKNVQVVPVFFGFYPVNLQISALPKKNIGRLLCQCFTVMGEK